MIVGEMVSRRQDGSSALMLCAADDPFEQSPKSYNVTFRSDGRAISATGGEGSVPVNKLKNGYYSVQISSNQGILIITQ